LPRVNGAIVSYLLWRGGVPATRWCGTFTDSLTLDNYQFISPRLHPVGGFFYPKHWLEETIIQFVSGEIKKEHARFF
jgi:hypothetical protein